MADEAQGPGNFTSAESRVAAGEGRDSIGQLETRGIDYSGC
jgi:hypothetical protein